MDVYSQRIQDSIGQDFQDGLKKRISLDCRCPSFQPSNNQNLEGKDEKVHCAAREELYIKFKLFEEQLFEHAAAL